MIRFIPLTSLLKRTLIYNVPAFLFLFITLTIAWYKYTHFLYNMNDLAIFHNALSQPFSSFLFSTIQGHPYFGDHISPYLALIKFIHLLAPHSFTLIALQALFLTSGIIPIYYLIHKSFSKRQQLLISLLYFFNPIIIAIALNEFHMLTLALPLLLWTFYFFQRKNYPLFLLLLILTTIIREDLFLTVIVFSGIALIDKRSLKWILTPLCTPIYFFIATYITSYFLGGNGYQFLYYYSWLGDSIGSIVINLFLHIDKVILRFIDLKVIEFLFIGFLFFLFIPLYKKKYLLFGLLPYAILVLGPVKDIEIYQFHYAIPMLFALLLSTIYGLQVIQKKYSLSIAQHTPLVSIVTIVTLFYTNLVFGPYVTLAKEISNPNTNAYNAYQKAIISKIEPHTPVLASYNYLNAINSSDVYALVYAYVNEQQFSIAPYVLPNNLKYIVINFEDVLNFYLRSEKETFNENSEHLGYLVKDLILEQLSDTFALFTKSQTPNIVPLINIRHNSLDTSTIQLTDEIGISQPQTIIDDTFLKTSINFYSKDTPADNYILKLSFTDAEGAIIFEKYYPLSYGIYPTSLWVAGDTANLTYKFHIPITKNELSQAHIQLVTLAGGTDLNRLSSAIQVIETETVYSDPVTIYSF